MATLTPFLWFNGRVEEAVEFYTSVFGDSAVEDISRYPEGSPGPAGDVMTATLSLAGQQLTILNGGPEYTLTPAFSFFVACADQAEVDHYWDRLCEGGKPVACGWLEDKFGVSWQVVPTVLGELLADPDPERSQRVMQAMLAMTKLDIAGLQAAHAGAAQRP